MRAITDSTAMANVISELGDDSGMQVERSKNETATLRALLHVLQLQPGAAALASSLKDPAGLELLLSSFSAPFAPGARVGPRLGAVPLQSAAAGCGTSAAGGLAQGSGSVPVPDGIVHGAQGGLLVVACEHFEGMARSAS